MAYDPMSPGAAAIARGVQRLFGDLGYAGLCEMTLANGRRADVALLGAGGDLAIVEVKSCAADFRADSKWREYMPFCDRFYFAVDHAFPQSLIPRAVGLIVADGFGGAVLREPPVEKLAAARRKAMTLRFARLASSRLQAALAAGLDVSVINR